MTAWTESLIIFFCLALAFFLLPRVVPQKWNSRTLVISSARYALVFSAALFFSFHIQRKHNHSHQALHFTQKETHLPWVSSVEEALSKSKQEGKGILLDFGADWCAACEELETQTYANDQVLARLKKSFIMAKVDSTRPTEQSMKWQEKFEVSALPTVVFLDANGKKLPKGSFVGFVNASDMLDILGEVEAQMNERGQCTSC